MNTSITDTTDLSVILQGVSPAVATLHIRSDNIDGLLNRPRVAIVGSRKVTPYGRAVTARLAGELAGQGVIIVSGLAYGVDAIAHQAALDAGGLTMAVLPGSLDEVYPRTHRGLADRIVEGGGALISEYEPGYSVRKWSFIERNRIVSGISDALLIPEAAINSGTMHTVRFALEQGKDVLAVPGDITSPTSEGTNSLIKTGAMLVTSTADVLNVLGLKPQTKKQIVGSTPDEQLLLDLLADSPTEGNQLLEQSCLALEKFNQALVMLEITGKIRNVGNNRWTIA